MVDLLSSAVRYLEDDLVDASEFSEVELYVLDAINQKVAAGQNLDDVMNFVFDATRNLFPCDRISVAFLEEDGARLVSYWTRARYEPVLLGKGYAGDMRGSSLQRVLDNGTPRIINDLEVYYRDHPNSPSTRLVLEEGIRSSMTCPLVVEGRAIGFMFRSCRRRNVYTDHLVELHQAIAERLSQAIEKMWRIEQLAAANRAYFEMLGFVSHELKSPLASLVMDAEILRLNYLGAVSSKQQEKLRLIIDKANYLIGVVNEYLDLARLESNEITLNVKTANLAKEVVGVALSVTQTLMEEKHVRCDLEVPDGLPIECDPGLLGIVLVNLLSNAVKYGEENGQIRVSAERIETRERDGAAVRISVWNSGPGFPASERSKLFRKFSRLQSPELAKRKGTGVGLYTTWRIVQMHGGKLWAKSEEGAWAEFFVEIPQPLPAATSEARVRSMPGGNTGN